MSKFLKFALLTLALQPLPALAQIETEHGFPISETSAGDLPCHMVTDRGNTLDLARLCGGSRTVTRSATSTAQRVSVRRQRLRDGKFSQQYRLLAESYPDERVRNMLSPTSSYTESVCKRLEEGKTVEEIRIEDIGKLTQNPSGDSSRDNARKQNIEITLKAAPQYYCPGG
ncbi:hypothetical protein NIES2119_27235 [[Phormidium ambiguum] IAM M-71]|uniref:DUF732 domain-containing protein n=1 Tax=[Phormidium ambiguum] IAM M-71 TaxID=454136 RepID=A0A1U7I6X1_9CYAN|nr:hypothetical protein [Phormidium ambiguum]OKH32055.1 hypothetical protein NIES2119_27235 [Phormidium ambiguum IAM M-71]